MLNYVFKCGDSENSFSFEHTQKSVVSKHRECRRKVYLMVLIVTHYTIHPPTGILHLSTCNAISVHIIYTLVMMPPTLCIIAYMVHTLNLNTTMVMYISGPLQSFKTLPLCKTV